ncbi:MAG: hypothetical protein EBZ77_13865, partial [Chitinophagia bacterium]|nr:hypothetical protein [Chitinophagia bacterium]
PFHQLIMKARLHAKKHGLSESEFAEFQRIYEQELSGSGSAEVFTGTTNLMKVLGNVNAGVDSYFNVDSADARNLQEILKLHEASKQLHSQVIQSKWNAIIYPYYIQLLSSIKLTNYCSI